jgi:hypothetical protein
MTDKAVEAGDLGGAARGVPPGAAGVPALGYASADGGWGKRLRQLIAVVCVLAWMNFIFAAAQVFKLIYHWADNVATRLVSPAIVWHWLLQSAIQTVGWIVVALSLTGLLVGRRRARDVLLYATVILAVLELAFGVWFTLLTERRLPFWPLNGPEEDIAVPTWLLAAVGPIVELFPLVAVLLRTGTRAGSADARGRMAAAAAGAAILPAAYLWLAHSGALWQRSMFALTSWTAPAVVGWPLPLPWRCMFAIGVLVQPVAAGMVAIGAARAIVGRGQSVLRRAAVAMAGYAALIGGAQLGAEVQEAVRTLAGPPAGSVLMDNLYAVWVIALAAAAEVIAWLCVRAALDAERVD